jgi:transposase
MRTNLLRLPIAHKTSMDARSGQSTPAMARRAAAARLRRAVLTAGLTQEQVAERYKLGLRTVQRLLSGQTRMTALELLLELEAVGRKAA